MLHPRAVQYGTPRLVGNCMARTAIRVWQSGAMHSTSKVTLPSWCRPSGEPRPAGSTWLCAMSERVALLTGLPGSKLPML